MKFAKRLQQIQPSTTLEIAARANTLKMAGHSVISFAAGEPEFDPPEHLKQNTVLAIQKGYTHYLPAQGLPELRKAIAQKYQQELNLPYQAEEVIVSIGAKHVIYNAIYVLCEEGDEVLIPAPYWLSYPEQVRLAEATPVIVPTIESNQFQVTVEDLEKRYSTKTKLLILNSPSNPTGTIYSVENLQELAQWIESKPDLAIIFDEIYEKLTNDGKKHTNLLHIAPKLRSRCLLVNGYSKSHAITGWRIGYGVGPKEWIKQMNNLQSHSTSNAPSLLQYALADAYLAENMLFLQEIVKEYQARRDLIVRLIQQIPKLSCSKPQGAFYVFPDFSAYLGKKLKGVPIQDTAQLASFLLEEQKVATVPGGAFGAPTYIRFSYTLPQSQIQ
ncbi:MAG: pyridoxal phosphate-dependent aminotransferase, partial [Planctomycetota bacterium]